MIKLKEIVAKILSELDYQNKYYFSNRNHLFPDSANESVMFGIVISHKNGLTPDEAKDIIKAFKQNDDKSDLQYYAATKKIVGKVGVYKFFAVHKAAGKNSSSSPHIEQCKIKDKLDKIKKGLEITKKTIHK